MAFQAGLPLDKFMAVVPQPTEDSGTYYVPDTNTWLKKVLSHSDIEVNAKQKEWDEHIQAILETDPKAMECHTTLMEMIAERHVAIEQYGYGCELAQDLGLLEL